MYSYLLPSNAASKTAVILSWLLLIANYVAYFLIIWHNALAGRTTTTNLPS